jgi:hypothetical protein
VDNWKEALLAAWTGLAITAVLFAGPLFVMVSDGSMTILPLSYKSLAFWRNYVVVRALSLQQCGV